MSDQYTYVGTHADVIDGRPVAPGDGVTFNPDDPDHQRLAEAGLLLPQDTPAPPGAPASALTASADDDGEQEDPDA